MDGRTVYTAGTLSITYKGQPFFMPQCWIYVITWSLVSCVVCGSRYMFCSAMRLQHAQHNCEWMTEQCSEFIGMTYDGCVHNNIKPTSNNVCNTKSIVNVGTTLKGAVSRPVRPASSIETAIMAMRRVENLCPYSSLQHAHTHTQHTAQHTNI